MFNQPQLLWQFSEQLSRSEQFRGGERRATVSKTSKFRSLISSLKFWFFRSPTFWGQERVGSVSTWKLKIDLIISGKAKTNNMEMQLGPSPPTSEAASVEADIGPWSSVGSSGSGPVTHLLFSIPPCNKEPSHCSLVTDHFDECNSSFPSNRFLPHY